MISLYDDSWHVARACARLEQLPGDRFLVSWTHCVLGQSSDHSRWASLFFVVLASVLLWRAFFRSWKGLQGSALLVLHPMALFPFFYASQLSTAMSVAWASGVLLLLERSTSRRMLDGCLGLGLAVLGALLRFEGIAFVWMLFGALRGFRRLEGEPTPGRRPWARLLFFTGLFWVASRLAHTWLAGGIAASGFAADAVDVAQYPLAAWYGSQVLACLQYAFNLVFPALHSFYGSWSDWAIFLERPWLSFSALAVAMILLLGLMALVRERALGLPALKWPALGAVFFFIYCFGASALPRTDWYYPIRQQLATLVFLIFSLRGFREAALPARAKKAIAAACLLYLAASSAYSAVFHYGSDEGFLMHEVSVTRRTSPAVGLSIAAVAQKSGDLELALDQYRGVLEEVPVPVARASGRGAIFRIHALSGLYRLYRHANDQPNASLVLRALSVADHRLAVYACLSDPVAPIESCRSNPRAVAHFCGFSTELFSEPEHLPLRVSRSEFCRQWQALPARAELQSQ